MNKKYVMNNPNVQYEDGVKNQQIYYSKVIKAGKRIYYLDMKRSRFGDYYLAITESKKSVVGVDPATQMVFFEKHKIFLYKEDFDNFLQGIHELIDLITIRNEQSVLSNSTETDI
jgi:hypothetical protein